MCQSPGNIGHYDSLWCQPCHTKSFSLLSLFFNHYFNISGLLPNEKCAFVGPLFVGAPFLWGPLFGRTCWTCLNLSLVRCSLKPRNQNFELWSGTAVATLRIPLSQCRRGFTDVLYQCTTSQSLRFMDTSQCSTKQHRKTRLNYYRQHYYMGIMHVDHKLCIRAWPNL